MCVPRGFLGSRRRRSRLYLGALDDRFKHLRLLRLNAGGKKKRQSCQRSDHADSCEASGDASGFGLVGHLILPWNGRPDRKTLVLALASCNHIDDVGRRGSGRLGRGSDMFHRKNRLASVLNRAAWSTEGTSPVWLSMVLRRASWIFPELLAIASFEASAGVTSMVMTVTCSGRPARLSIRWLAARTRIFSRTVLVIFPESLVDSRRDHVDHGSGSHESGHRDHFVDRHGQRPHPLGNGGRQARSLRRRAPACFPEWVRFPQRW